jgi:hypothetical protein
MPRHSPTAPLCCALLFALVLPAVSAAGTAAPALSFDPASDATSVRGSGFTPGGQVVWFATARVVEDYYLTLAHYQSVTAVDAAGGASFDLGRPVPRASTWVAVDLTTGASVLASPTGSPVRLVDLGPGALSLGTGGAPDVVADRRSLVEALLVRPGVGAWELTVGDGGVADEDGVGDGHLQFSLSRMRPLVSAAPAATTAGSAPAAPANLGPQDLLVVLGADGLEVAVLHRVGKP